MLDILVGENIDICDKRAFDIMYEYLNNIDVGREYILHEEEKYGLKISVGMFRHVKVVRGYITNSKVIIYFDLFGSPNRQSNIRSVNYDDKTYATLYSYAYRVSTYTIIGSNHITNMVISSLVCRNVKSARK